MLGEIGLDHKLAGTIAIQIVDAEESITPTVGKGTSVFDLTGSGVKQKDLFPGQNRDLRLAIVVEIADDRLGREETIDRRGLPYLDPLPLLPGITSPHAVVRPIAVLGRLRERA